MSHDPVAAGRESPPRASPASVDAGLGIAMPADSAARHRDEPQAQTAPALEPEIVSAGSPPTVRSDEAISTADVLHWFG